MSLATLLGPVALADATAALEQRQFRHFSVGDANRLVSLYGWPEFMAALNMYKPNDATLRITKDGQKIPPEWLSGSTSSKVVDGRAFRNLVPQGISFVLNNLHEKLPTILTLWREAVTVFDGRVEFASIVTFGPGRAFEPHFDPCDLIIVQIAGTKVWEIMGTPAELPVNAPAARPADETVTARFVVAPGDVVVVPHSLGHRCHCDGDSLQISILIYGRHGYDYLKWLLDKAGEDPVMRRVAPISRDAAALADYEAAVKASIGDLMQRFSPRQFLQEKRARPTRDITLDDLPDPDRHRKSP